jgi:hypothetical protein
MRLPRGRLVRSRVVTGPRTVLVDALDRELTGYAVLEPQDALLLDAEGSGVLTFEAGVPVVAYHTGTDRGGPPALADLAAEGPYQLELYATERADLVPVHEESPFGVPPGMPAERLAGDQALADRTREAAPAERRRTVRTTGSHADRSVESKASSPAESPGSRADADPDRDGADADDGDRPGAVEAFLDDEEKIEAIREQARTEAEQRAEEWGF